MNTDTLLLRQAHPSFYQNGVLSSQAFFPFPKDENLLSVYDGDQITPTDAYKHYTTVQGFESVGCWGVTQLEGESLGLPSRPDPEGHFPEHAIIDFTGYSVKECKKLAKKLRDLADARGCLHSP